MHLLFFFQMEESQHALYAAVDQLAQHSAALGAQMEEDDDKIEAGMVVDMSCFGERVPQQGEFMGRIEMHARSLIKMEWLSKSDPMVAMFIRHTDKDAWRLQDHTEWLSNNHDPDFTTRLTLRNDGELDTRQIKFVVYDVDKVKVSAKDTMGWVETTVAELVRTQDEVQSHLLQNDTPLMRRKLAKKQSRLVYTMSETAEYNPADFDMYNTNANNLALQLQRLRRLNDSLSKSVARRVQHNDSLVLANATAETHTQALTEKRVTKSMVWQAELTRIRRENSALQLKAARRAEEFQVMFVSLRAQITALQVLIAGEGGTTVERQQAEWQLAELQEQLAALKVREAAVIEEEKVAAASAAAQEEEIVRNRPKHIGLVFGMVICDTNEGVEVELARPALPAMQAGIKEGDVIQKVNGRHLRRKSDFPALVKGVRPFDKVQLTVLDSNKRTRNVFIVPTPRETIQVEEVVKD